MPLRIASDLHIEAYAGKATEALIDVFLPKDDRDPDSILILAGDISSNLDQLVDFLALVEQHFKHVLFVPGNHCYYRHDMVEWNVTARATFDQRLKNTTYAIGEVLSTVIDGIRFIFGTLWADGGPTLADRGQVGHYLNDFRLITMPGRDYSQTRRRFSVDDMVAIHRQQKADITRFLETPFDGRTVVVTHHLPSRRLVSPRFWPDDGSDGANGGFASDCDNLFIDHEPDLWIFGHTHDRISTKLWNTRVECNPAGYRGEWATEHNSFMQVQLENGKQVVRAAPVFVRLSDLEIDPLPADHLDEV